MLDWNEKKVYLVAGHSMEIHGGGSTCAQMARAWTRRGYGVVYVAPDAHGGFCSDVAPILELPLGALSGFAERGQPYRGKEHDILHLALPSRAGFEFAKGFPGKVFYHCRDNWSLWMEHGIHNWPWYEAGLEAEIISVMPSFAVSPRLHDEKGTTTILENGYDPWVFQWQDHQARSSHVITWGFSGGFVDQRLLEAIIRVTPDIKYTLVGKASSLNMDIRKLANTNITGEVPMDHLPALAAEADLGLIVRKGDVAEYMCPIKSWEYLGSGLRFVSVGPDYPSRENNPACVAGGLHDLDTIVEAIYNAYVLLPDLGKEDALPHTWDERLGFVEEVLDGE